MDRPLKQRLVGAIILIALAIIFLPMLLDGSGQRNGHTPIVEIPERPDVEFQKRRLPIGEQARSSTREQPAPLTPPMPPVDEPSASQPAVDSAGVNDEQPPVAESSAADPELITATEDPGDSPEVAAAETETPAPAPAEMAEPTPALEAEADSSAAAMASLPESSDNSATPPANGGWYVQLGSFANNDNASRLAGQLQERGIANDLHTIPTGEGVTLYRVRAGPYASEAEAASMMQTLQNDIPGIQPRLAHDGGGSITPATQPRSGYAVQVGGFSSPANADKLVSQIEGMGISAFRERVEGSSGVIIKVKAGPVASEDDATALLRRIEQATGITGLVVRQP